MNTIEALQALKEGKKITNKGWKEDNYYRLKKHHLVNKAGKEVIYSLRFGTQGDITKDEWEIYIPPILDDVEKQYLSNIIAPFRDKIKSIRKYTNDNYERIVIRYNDKFDEDLLWFPSFKEGNMYKNMKIGKEYTLEELGL